MNPEHVTLLQQDLRRWNEWREKQPGLRAELSQANFHEADLRGANLWAANLRGANLREADLHGVDLGVADLRKADLRGANLYAADLRGANLREADLRETRLHEVDLGGAKLFRTNLRQAIFSSTLLTNLDLSGAKGLEMVSHRGPSSIDISTIYKSAGNIPEVFLRGAGVPENFIAYVRSLAGRPIDFYSCFISCSSKDQEFAERLYADLQTKGVRCWFAPHDILGGRKIDEQIDQAIRVYERLLLILSNASMSSNWVKTEIANARAREERDGRQMLFPVTLVPFEQVFDADTGIDSAREIREYFIPDFSRWKDHDAYQEAFARLLRDLTKAAEHAERE